LPIIEFEELQFKKYSGDSLPENFEYNENDFDLVRFYNEDAERLQNESIVNVYDVFYKKGLIGFVAYCPSEIHFSALKKEDKLAPFSHPAIKIGRLLVCNTMRGCRVGTHILTFVVAKAIKFKEEISFRFIIADSLPQSVGFYQKNGFIDSGVKKGSDRDQSLMYIDINQID
jgi:GNAT superfamily N-acetyltransferase